MLYCALVPTTMAKLLVLLLTPLAPLSAMRLDAPLGGQGRRGGWMFLKEGGGGAAPFLQRILPSPGVDRTSKREVPAGGGVGVGANPLATLPRA